MARSILLLTNRIPYPLHDGGALAMDAMVRGYHAAGWQVHLLAMNTARHFVPDDVLKGLYTGIASFYTVFVDNEVSTGRILKNLLLSREPEHADRFRSTAFAAKLEQLLRSIRPDVVQLESPFLASYLTVMRAQGRAKVVYRAHNIESQIWSRLAGEAGGMRRIYLNVLSRRVARYEEALWQRVDLILPITEADAATIRSRGAQTQLVVAPFGIHPPGEPPTPPRRFFKAYHLGAMDWLPNQQGISWFLKEVWPLVRQWSPDAEFHFAGRAMPASFFRDLPEGAFCAGEVGDAAAFIADKHILVVPIWSGGGIRIKILEAMAAGKLVISTRVGMQGIEAQPMLQYLSADNAQQFAHFIAWASTHAEKAEAHIYSAQRLIQEQYDAGVIMKRVIAALDTKTSG